MKLGIVGAGMIVKDFLTMTPLLPEIELKAITGTPHGIDDMEKLQKQYGIDRVYTDIDECLANEEIDTIYVAVPNHLHFAFAKKALEAGKNVICEKPFTLNLAELEELAELAQTKQLILLEAITNQYMMNYQKIKEAVPTLGEIKVIECNYSQYSSRYDAFKAGEVLPAFNPKFGGGALMDINIYNIHFVVGLLGAPSSVKYLANIEKDIDTSGILILNYPDTKVVCIGAKDSTATIRSTIQGTKGSVIVNGATNVLDNFDIESKAGIENFDFKQNSHRMYEEFKAFQRIIAEKDLKEAALRLQHSEEVLRVVEQALADAHIQLG
ncbi:MULTISPECIES: Gfo/Idh/MocA family protein [Pediococcus]|uniref:Predicted dehydrogenase related protein n=1 Tax=Pediococcus pentosaceus (strain ATCC 25745 / CCUG 21536 / LMG 10740 / 183-1w) TaxID=278197 RepID=Q03HW5_PEDPA|nr:MULTISPECIES: Gfo/Idh/MocA family oxidoreductase [Pediococcus]ABJ67207.1 Predicted dehydrogenase related protein [Pediococcus pentosaceus ATCC 25745]KAF5439894.1 Gfo/Idh/MocA family oxidoreductase [Pediococcus sp. EKM202D]KAF5440664.1 Gfo/Idh/MocA family oxidoreductase [Pediococcus sp. EKM201D]QHM65247.1 putative oxidoreductase YhhX [Pediococcus pentosaceus]QHM66966.1 putative oxidoreductase YhhX [Pediococcus pentosaceus]